MTFSELTRVMLSSMDFFELRRTAARYAVPFQGVRRSKLLRDLEKKIISKGAMAAGATTPAATVPAKIVSKAADEKSRPASRK